jgi:hypothetical protein
LIRRSAGSCSRAEIDPADPGGVSRGEAAEPGLDLPPLAGRAFGILVADIGHRQAIEVAVDPHRVFEEGVVAVGDLPKGGDERGIDRAWTGRTDAVAIKEGFERGDIARGLRERGAEFGRLRSGVDRVEVPAGEHIRSSRCGIHSWQMLPSFPDEPGASYYPGFGIEHSSASGC